MKLISGWARSVETETVSTVPVDSCHFFGGSSPLRGGWTSCPPRVRAGHIDCRPRPAGRPSRLPTIPPEIVVLTVSVTTCSDWLIGRFASDRNPPGHRRGGFSTFGRRPMGKTKRKPLKRRNPIAATLRRFGHKVVPSRKCVPKRETGRAKRIRNTISQP